MSDSDLSVERCDRVSRRSLIRGALSIGGLAALSHVALAPEAVADTALAKVPSFAAPSRRLFLDNEQVLARYLMTTVPMANDIVDDPDDEFYGFMGGGWWRDEATQTKQNSRIMEHVATLAWFYANQRDWNPLYRSATLLARLEASIGYYTSLQLSDGSYPEHRGNSSLAATTFGIVAQAETYEALRKRGDSQKSRERLRLSMVKAVNWFMDEQAAHWLSPVAYFNQVAAGLVGAQRALQVLGAPPVDQAAINERISYLCAEGQAPAGFLHEPFGVDFGYNFTVTMPDLAWLYTQTQHPDIVPLVTRYMDFMQYAVLPEPGTGGLWHIPALHVRNIMTGVSRSAQDLLDRGAMAKALLPAVPSIALFLPTAEEKVAARIAFAEAGQPIRAFDNADTSPRTWMYGVLAPEGPAKASRDAVEAQLPVLTSERFSKLEDGSKNDQYLFVRRPSYYVASVFGYWTGGDRSTRQLGTLWNPTLGTILVGTNDPDNPEGWETVGPGGAFTTRKSSSTSQYFDSRTSAPTRVIDAAGVRQKTTLLAQRTQSAAGVGEYVTGWGYWDQGVRFAFITQRAGDCTQRLPLLLKGADSLTFSDGSTFTAGDAGRAAQTSSIVLNRNGARVLFDFGPSTLRTFLRPTGREMSGGQIHRVGVIFQSQIVVNTVFLTDVPGEPVQAEAHRHSNNEVSLRVTVYPAVAKAVAQLRVTGDGVSEVIDVAAAGFQVVERTLTPDRAGATQLTINAHAADGSLIGGTTAAVR